MVILATALLRFLTILLQVFTAHGSKIGKYLFIIVGYPPLGRKILRHLYRMYDDIQRAELQTR